MYNFNSKNLDLFQKPLKNLLKRLPKKYQIQLTFLYILAFFLAIRRAKKNLRRYESNQNAIFRPFFNPFFRSFFNTFFKIFNTFFKIFFNIFFRPFFRVLSRPSALFLSYYMLMEFLILNHSLKMSNLLRFHIFFVLIIEMFQNLILCCWEVIKSRQLELVKISKRKKKKPLFFRAIFLVIICTFLYAYVFSYWEGMKGNFPIFKSQFFKKICDSIVFWIRFQRIPKK